MTRATQPPRRRSAAAFALALVVAACAAVRVRADDATAAEQAEGDDDARHRPYVWLGFGLADGEATSATGGHEHSEDSDVSGRLEAGYAHPVLPFLSVGALAQRLGWRTELDAAALRDGSLLHALSLAAELRLETPQRGVFFARVAVGALLDELATTGENGFRERADTALGLHLGARGGVQVIVFAHFGVQLELAFDRYLFEHTVTVVSAQGAAFSASDEIDYTLDTTTAHAAIVVPF